MTDARSGAAVAEPARDSSHLPPPVLRARRNHQRVLRILGVLFVALSVALLLIPSLTPGGLLGVENANCGMLLEGLFAPPGSTCLRVATTKAHFAIVYAGLGVLLLTFSGIRNRLRLWGIAIFGASPYLMMFPNGTPKMIGNVSPMCASPIGDLTRRGVTALGMGGGTWTLHPDCPDRALTRFYIMLAVAGFGLLLVCVGALMSRRGTLNGMTA